MMYVTYRNSYFDGRKVVNNIWNVDYEDVEQRYIEFMRERAHEINIVINPHWLNIMNWKDHNDHLSIEEYREKEQQWAKIRRQWNVDKFISEVLRGRKERFRNL
jgi:hypothetical protein